MMATSFPGSLFFPSLERDSLSRLQGREEERPWERGCHHDGCRVSINFEEMNIMSSYHIVGVRNVLKVFKRQVKQQQSLACGILVVRSIISIIIYNIDWILRAL